MVTVIIPTYNQREMVQEAIQSVLRHISVTVEVDYQ